MDMTEWHVEGELYCPDDCGLYFDFDGSFPDLQKFIADHDCAKALAEAEE